MSYEVIQRVGRYQYIYLADGYRNSEGQVRQNRRPIGKINPKTGQKVYKPEYLEERRRAGQPVEIPTTEKIFSVDDIRQSSVPLGLSTCIVRSERHWVCPLHSGRLYRMPGRSCSCWRVT